MFIFFEKGNVKLTWRIREIYSCFFIVCVCNFDSSFMSFIIFFVISRFSIFRVIMFLLTFLISMKGKSNSKENLMAAVAKGKEMQYSLLYEQGL